MKKTVPIFVLTMLLLVSCTVATAPDPASTEAPPQPTPVAAATEISAPSPTETADLPPADAPVETIQLTYAEEDPIHNLNLYLPPTGEGPFPTILAIHGGGFRSRSKSLYNTIGRHFARNGYAFISINYRLAPKSSFPAQVEDSFCALAWLHANHEEYGFDPDQVVVLGGSAGGYLASMLVTVDDPSIYLQNCPNAYPDGQAVHAAAIFYGLFDFTNVDDYPPREIAALASFFGSPYDEISTEQLVAMSPIMHIDGSEPPFILLHGTADATIPSVMSERFAAALEQADVDVELVLIPDADHAFELTPLDGEEMTISLNAVEAFLERVLTPQ